MHGFTSCMETNKHRDAARDILQKNKSKLRKAKSKENVIDITSIMYKARSNEIYLGIGIVQSNFLLTKKA